jgi:hypothetical protein
MALDRVIVPAGCEYELRESCETAAFIHAPTSDPEHQEGGVEEPQSLAFSTPFTSEATMLFEILADVPYIATVRPTSAICAPATWMRASRESSVDRRFMRSIVSLSN